MGHPEVLDAPPAKLRRAALRGSVARVGRLLGRTPGRVRTKLLLAFLVIAALLVVVGVLGFRVLGQANARVERLDALQVRAARYQEIESHAGDLQQTLGVRAAGASNLAPYTGDKTLPPSGELWTLADLQVANTLSQVELATDEPLFGFVPPPADERKLRRMLADYGAIVRALAHIQQLDKHPVTGVVAQKYINAARVAGDDLDARAQELAFKARAETQALVETNRSEYVSSRNLFIGVSAGAVLLALALGLLLSWLLTGPIRRTEARLAEIAGGDFSGRLDVLNRDELGSLAANVNRMNDELRRLYGELETTSRHKSEFLANMSHELRTPLNAIIGFSQVLRERLFGDVNEKQEEYLDDILSSGNHLLSLINDVLDLSKVEAGQLELVIAPFSLREALERGATMVRDSAVKSGVELLLRIDPEVDLAQGDERRILQVTFNLLSNAVKFTPQGGHVDIESTQVGGEIRVSVRDTGPGIAPEDQERIFEEFQQTDVGRKQQEGTGLGLALSRRLIDLHHGRLWVESTLGQGSTFSFTLPGAREPVSA
jgi:signal transduction histidine kinase